ncbi:hypothetical protein KBX03_03095 [Micromonospora sp. C72]|uniref:trypco2 family protein n=1 Tax=unclassified Micromonospora TaxID=2617518 RepID=UPI001B37FB67|nr:trypco2 family protein [Micromonospora sp. C72]MBQ1041487.1 hypothetical protein [Micromonospora sp. C72]
MSKPSQIGLAEVLCQLRAELSLAQQGGDGQRLRFEVTEAEVELEVAVSREGGPGGKVKIDVVALGGVELGAEAKRSTAQTHRISLKLTVTDEVAGGNAKVSSTARRGWKD